MDNPWVLPFTAYRTRAIANAIELEGALSTGQLQPGDLLDLEAADYPGVFSPKVEGTEEKPILIRGKRGVRILGGFHLNRKYTRLNACAVTDNPASPDVEGISLLAPYTAAINNLTYGMVNVIGIGAWNLGPGQIVYGNICLPNVSQEPLPKNPHNTYAQNRYSTNGKKYIIGNIALDSETVTDNTFNLHNYAEGNYCQGFHVYNNIFANGRTLNGSRSSVSSDHHSVFIGNALYKASFGVGYQRPSQVQLIQNYLGKSTLKAKQWQAAGEMRYLDALEMPGICEFNEFIAEPGQKHFEFAVAHYPNPTGSQSNGTGIIRPEDRWNSNTYWGSFFCSFNAGGVNAAGVTRLQDWQKLTRDTGKNAFDLASTNPPGLPPNKILGFENEYDRSLIYMAAYNWEMLESMPIAAQNEFEIYDASDPNGNSIAVSDQGVCNVPMEGKEFRALIMKKSSDPLPEPLQPLRAEIEKLKTLRGNLKTTSVKALRDRVKTSLDSVIPELVKCADSYEPA